MIRIKLPRFIDPLSDFGFKLLFGTEKNKRFLIAMLNALVLPLNMQIADLEYRNSEKIGETDGERRKVLDLYCISTTGIRFVVEVQRKFQKFLFDRMLFYATAPIIEQAPKGKRWNYNLQPIFILSILDHCLEKGTKGDNKMRIVKLKDQNCKVMSEKLTFVVVERPRIKLRLEDIENEAQNWLYLFDQMSHLKSKPMFHNEIFDQFLDAAEVASLDPVERNLYLDSLKVARDHYAVEEYEREQAELKRAKDKARIEKVEAKLAKAEAKVAEEKKKAAEEKKKAAEEKKKAAEANTKVAEEKKKVAEEKEKAFEAQKETELATKRVIKAAQGFHAIGWSVSDIAQQLDITDEDVQAYLSL